MEENERKNRMPGYVVDAIVAQGAFIASALFKPKKVIKVKFDNEDEAAKGLEVLLSSKYSIRCYKDAYGLVCDEQLSLLDKHRVKYTKIDH